ncbi:YARHG domain-containing protein [Devosia sp.]|uniref:YARHG domain-containing protein n=1 Tax=Devosia sp. TaxID=1871048 RepID=UPI0025ECFF1F|nr:YARHG domain-containing protein [Devosia sp.]MCR6635940.1 YARHG domain-containing protein [Devosia sp.]
MLRGFAVTLAMLASMSSAFANCYEMIGCDDSDYFRRSDLRQLSCQSLWEVRNWIYKQNGYCFSTQRAKNAFGNEGCFITNQAQVKLNAVERENVATIASVEKSRGCN